jgi:hypothetical protein
MNLKELLFTEESVIDVNFIKEVDRILDEVNALENPQFYYKCDSMEFKEFEQSGILNTTFIDHDCSVVVYRRDDTLFFTEWLKFFTEWLKDREYNSNNNCVDVFFIKTLLNIRRNINKLDNPTFIDNGVIIKIDDEFAYTGLSNFDFITMDYYKNR